MVFSESGHEKKKKTLSRWQGASVSPCKCWHLSIPSLDGLSYGLEQLSPSLCGKNSQFGLKAGAVFGGFFCAVSALFMSWQQLLQSSSLVAATAGNSFVRSKFLWSGKFFDAPSEGVTSPTSFPSRHFSRLSKTSLFTLRKVLSLAYFHYHLLQTPQ